MCSKRLPNRLIKKSFRAYNTGSLLENLILLNGDMGGLLLLQCPEQHIQRTAVLLVLLPHIGKIHHVDHGLKVLLILWRFMDEVEHERGIQRNLSLFPEGVIAGGVTGRSVFDKIVDEGQHILFLPHIDEGIVAVGLFGVDEIEYPHFIAERQKQAPRCLQQFLR